MKKHTIKSVLKTVFQNPKLGEKYKDIIIETKARGHELGLHGGMDHVIWQRKLNSLSSEELFCLFRPAYEKFRSLFGKPAGFSSPGFMFNEKVLELIDYFDFKYASDMEGTCPHKCIFNGKSYNHYQIPVNIIGQRKVPVIEECLAKGFSPKEIVTNVVKQIKAADYAVLYGHPFVEGIYYEIFEQIISSLAKEYKFVSMDKYLDTWCKSNNP